MKECIPDNSDTNHVNRDYSIKGIIFDLDDTLAPEIDYIYSGYRFVSSHIEKVNKINKELIFERMKHHFLFGDKTKIFNNVIKDFNLPLTNNIEELVQIYRCHIPDPSYRLFKDSYSNLIQFHKKFKCALLTDGYYPTQENKITSLKIEKFFDPIIINHCKNRFKPDRQSYEQIMEQWRINPKKILVIGDNPAKDFITPNCFKMITVRLLRKNAIRRNEGDDIQKALHTIKSLKQLWKLLMQINSGI